MAELVNRIGGYDSWQFTIIMLGFLSVGLILRIKWVWAIPIPLIGLWLMYLSLNNAYEVASTNIANNATNGVASTLPILATAIGLSVIIDPSVVSRIFGLSHKSEDK